MIVITNQCVRCAKSRSLHQLIIHFVLCAGGNVKETNMDIQLNEQQVDFLKTFMGQIVAYDVDEEFSNTSIAIAQQIINKLEEK